MFNFFPNHKKLLYVLFAMKKSPNKSVSYYDKHIQTKKII